MDKRTAVHKSPRLILPAFLALLGLVLSISASMAQATGVTKGTTLSDVALAGSRALAAMAPMNAAKGEASNAIPLSCSLTVDGNIQSSDPVQAGRLVTLLNASSCASPRSYPGASDALAHHYDAYTFVNPSASPVCVTVDLTPLSLDLVQSVAYLGSFNPNALGQNYLADIGTVNAVLGGSYSFTVPGNATFVVVVNELVPNVNIGTYRLRVTVPGSNPCVLTATPTATSNVPATQTSVAATASAVGATATSVSQTQTAIAPTSTHTPLPTSTACAVSGAITPNDSVQHGRMVTLLGASSCDNPRGYPGTFDTLDRNYDAYYYRNDTNSPVCVTVQISNSCLSGILLQSAAYLGTFNPNNLGENYLGDVGPGILNNSSYSFTVPANSQYVVVVSPLLPLDVCTVYSLQVSTSAGGQCPIVVTPTPTPTGGTATPTATQNSATRTAAATQTSGAATQTAIASQTSGAQTPTALPTATQCVVTGSLGATDPLQVGQVNGLLLPPTSCQNSRGYPGSLDLLNRHYDAYTYHNSSNSPVCVTVNINNSCGSAILLQSTAYLGSFDPDNIGTNYLGDVGPGILNNSTYSFVVPANSDYVVVVNEVLPLSLCTSYSLSVTTSGGGQCPIIGTPTATGTATPNQGATQTAIASQTSGAGTQTAIASQTSGALTATPNPATQTAAATQTSGAATQTAIASQTSGAGTGTPNPATRTAIATQTSGAATQTAIASMTAGAPTETATAGSPTATPTHCPIEFADVPPDHVFYTYIRCMVCRGIINGYACGGPGEPCNQDNQPYFRSANNVTRAQTAKMASNSAGFHDEIPAEQQTFEDVPPSSTFWPFIERLAMRGYIDGYDCGGPGEPCVAPMNRRYFRPASYILRGQISKVVSNSAGFNDAIPQEQQTFQDVPNTDTFWVWVERLSMRGVMQGYACDTPQGGPCVPPLNLPYFFAYNPASRGQTAKIISNTFFPNCYTPRPQP